MGTEVHQDRRTRRQRERGQAERAELDRVAEEQWEDFEELRNWDGDDG